MILLIVIPVVIFIIEIVTISVMGFPVHKKHTGRIQLKLKDYSVDEGILTGTGDLPYISKVFPIPSVFFSYYIENVGVVFRFSLLSHSIKKRFNELKIKESKKSKAIDKFYN